MNPTACTQGARSAMRRTTALRLAATAVLVGLAATACGTGSTDDPANAGQTSQPAEPAAIDTGATIDVRLVLEPTSLDIASTAGAALDQILLDNVYQGLLTRDENNNIKSSLATSYDTSPDGLTYTSASPRTLGQQLHDDSAEVPPLEQFLQCLRGPFDARDPHMRKGDLTGAQPAAEPLGPLLPHLGMIEARWLGELTTATRTCRPPTARRTCSPSTARRPRPTSGTRTFLGGAKKASTYKECRVEVWARRTPLRIRAVSIVVSVHCPCGKYGHFRRKMGSDVGLRRTFQESGRSPPDRRAAP